MEKYTLEETKNFIIEESKDDYTNLHDFFISAVTCSEMDPDGNRMEQTLDLIRWALAHGFEAVDLAKEAPGYRTWPNQDPDHVIATIRAEWEASDEPSVGFLYWFRLPPERL